MDVLRDPDLQAYYDRQFEMMASRAWQEFLEDVRRACDSYADPRRIEDERTLFYIKGLLAQCDTILMREAALRQAFDTLVEQDREAAE